MTQQEWQEGEDAAFALRVFAEFKWKLRIADRTYEDIERLLGEAIEACNGIVTPKIREDTIQKFSEMRNRVSEFTV